MKRKSLVLVCALLFASCSKQPAQQNAGSASKVTPSSADFRNNVSLATSVAPSQNEFASDFSWYDNSGKLVSLKSLRGKTVLINFWATWCGPCKAELPDIESISKEYASKGLVIVGVSVDKGSDLLNQVSSFVSDNGLTYQIVIDNDDVADAFGNINVIPTSFIVDKDGKIATRWLGERDKTYLESTIKKFLD
ncbi:MAG TPA: TlpA disulfide reductase family protein [Candidatus Kryptonia bacterium]